jgi:LysM repeat protein
MVRLKSLRWLAVFGAILAAIALVAPAVLAQSADSATAFELVGNIDAMNSSSIAIHGQIIDIIGAEVSVALEVGLAVRVHGAVMPDGRIIASEVDAAENDNMLPGEIEVIGVWPAEVGNKAVIGGVVFNLTSAEIDPGLIAGDLAVVHASLSPEGMWAVREVRLFVGDDNDNDNVDDNSNDNHGDNSNDNIDDNSNDNANGGASDEVELTGTLESVGDGFIVVSGARIDTRSAEIHGTLIVGTLVKVHVRVVDGNMVAREAEQVSRRNNNNSDNDNLNDDSNDNGNDNSNDNEDDSRLPTIPGDCVAVMPAGWTTYTIQAGDTLSSIAGRTGASMSNLMRVNCIADPGRIVAGASIFVPRTPVRNSNDNNANNNDNNDDRGNDNSNDNSDDRGNDNGNDNSDDRGNDNRDDRGDNDDNDNNRGRGSDDD